MQYIIRLKLLMMNNNAKLEIYSGTQNATEDKQVIENIEN